MVEGTKKHRLLVYAEVLSKELGGYDVEKDHNVWESMAYTLGGAEKVQQHECVCCASRQNLSVIKVFQWTIVHFGWSRNLQGPQG